MKREKTNRLKSKIVFSAILLIIGYVVLLHLPQVFISKQFEYKSLHIHSNQSLKLDDESKAVLDLVLENIGSSAYYKMGQEHHLFFVHGTLYEKMVRSIGYKNMAFAFMDKSIYCAKPDFLTRYLRRNKNEYEVMHLVQVISHELVHNQMYDILGFNAIRKLKPWVREGYPEYIAYGQIQDSEDYQLADLSKRIASRKDPLWVTNEYDCLTSYTYAMDRLRMEFALDIQQSDIQNIMEINLAAAEIDKTIEQHFK
ncbi:MAG: hypothetical protein AB8F74_12065 [Saprospiraceae bacterium]